MKTTEKAMSRISHFFSQAVFFVLFAFLVLKVSSAFAAVPESCPTDLAMKALDEASTLKTWQAFFVSYKKYKRCDDGAIAEGYSSSIATLLSDRWQDIGQLIRLGNEDPSFRRFVLSHVDVTMSLDQATTIKKNVAQKCPSGAKKLCADIKRQFVSEGF
jgi:hypothetical protein